MEHHAQDKLPLHLTLSIDALLTLTVEEADNACLQVSITNFHAAWRQSLHLLYRFVVRPSRIAGQGVFATGRLHRVIHLADNDQALLLQAG